MTGTSKKTQVPKTKGNGKVHPMPSGPSPKVRTNFIKKIRQINKKKQKKKPGENKHVT